MTPADIDLFDGLAGSVEYDAGLSDFTAWDGSVSNFTAINEAIPAPGSTQTVSPKDVFASDSAPPSAAFTNLTSPDISGPSPFGGSDSYQTSPAFMTEGDFTSTTGDNWFPLFPDEANSNSIALPEAIQRTISDHSIQTSSSGGSPASLHAHRKSITDTPPSARHSAVSGVKPRRRKGPLPDIALDPHDKVAYKRARNTLAARDSRQRKLEHVSNLEGRIAELEDEVQKWRNIAAQYGHSEL